MRILGICQAIYGKAWVVICLHLRTLLNLWLFSGQWADMNLDFGGGCLWSSRTWLCWIEFMVRKRI